jgi:hypothetical protein
LSIGHWTARVAALLVGCILLVTPALADPREDALKEMRPATGIEGEPTSFWSSWPTLLIYGGLGLVAIALGAGLAIRLARGGTKNVVLSAQQAALRDLKRIEGLQLTEKGELTRYVTELSNVVRRFLENRYQIAATRQTTPEFLETMRTSRALTPDQQTLLREFLEQCDQAKFAGATPSAEQSQTLAKAARRLVEQAT